MKENSMDELFVVQCFQSKAQKMRLVNVSKNYGKTINFAVPNYLFYVEIEPEKLKNLTMDLEKTGVEFEFTYGEFWGEVKGKKKNLGCFVS